MPQKRESQMWNNANKGENAKLNLKKPRKSQMRIKAK